MKRTVEVINKSFVPASYSGNYSFNRPTDDCLYVKFLKQLSFGPKKTAQALQDAEMISNEYEWSMGRHYCGMVSTLKRAGLIRFKNRQCELTSDGYRYMLRQSVNSKIDPTKASC